VHSTCWVLCKRNVSCSVGIIFYSLKRSLSIYNTPLEVNDAVQPFVSASSVVGGNPALRIAAPCVPDPLCQRFVRPAFPKVSSISNDTSSHACIDETTTVGLIRISKRKSVHLTFSII